MFNEEKSNKMGEEKMKERDKPLKPLGNAFGGKKQKTKKRSN